MMRAQTNVGSDTRPLPTRFVYAGIGLLMGLTLGSVIWLYESLIHQHHHILTILVLISAVTAIGFFASNKVAAWLDTILYFVLLGFMDR